MRVAALGGLADPVDVLQDPLHLARREVRGRRQPGLAADDVPAAVAVERRSDPVGAGVLPDDRVVVRPPGVTVPHQRRLALVGDAERGQIAGPQIGPVQGRLQHRRRCVPRSPPGCVPPSPPAAGSARVRAGGVPPRDRRGRRSCRACWWCPGRSPRRSRPTPCSCRARCPMVNDGDRELGTDIDTDAPRRPRRVVPGPPAGDRPRRVPRPRRRRRADQAQRGPLAGVDRRGVQEPREVRDASRSTSSPMSPDPKILELGAGHGGLSRKLLEQHPTARVTVTDIDPTSVVKIAAGELGSHPRATVEMDATEIDVRTGISTWRCSRCRSTTCRRLAGRCGVRRGHPGSRQAADHRPAAAAGAAAPRAAGDDAAVRTRPVRARRGDQLAALPTARRRCGRSPRMPIRRSRWSCAAGGSVRRCWSPVGGLTPSRHESCDLVAALLR